MSPIASSIGFEVAVIGRQPAIDHFDHLDLAFAQIEPHRRLLAAIAGVALDPNR